MPEHPQHFKDFSKNFDLNGASLVFRMINKPLLGMFCLTGVLLAACTSPSVRHYGMDYDVSHSRAWNTLKFFGYAPIPSDTAAPAGLTDVMTAPVDFALLKKPIETPVATSVKPQVIPGEYSPEGLIRAMSQTLTTSVRDNQFFGFVDNTDVQGNVNAQKRFVSVFARSFFTIMRRSMPERKWYLDLVRTTRDGDVLTHSMAVFLEDESLGCRYASDAAIGTCGALFISRSQETTKPTLIPFAIGGAKQKAEKIRPEEILTSFLEREERLGFRYGSHSNSEAKVSSGMPFFRWNGTAWTKTNEFDALFENSFPGFVKSLPPLHFVFHKQTAQNPAYIIEGNQFDFFLMPTKKLTPPTREDR